VITLRNGEKIELRSLPDFKTCEKEIAARMYKEKIIDF
jgi:nitrogen fixation protein